MPSVSSLLKSAQATQKKVRQQEDAFMAYQWESSAQTYDDFVEYSKYLQNRAKTSADPSEALTYQTKIRSANRSYTSNEIQREQMKIMEGRGNTQSKMDAVRSLWERAMQSEDYNLAQNLVSQWDTLSVKLQNEQEQAAKDAEAATRSYLTNNKKAANNLIKDLQKGFDDVTLPDGTKVTGLGAIARDLEQNGTSPGTWKAAQETLGALRNMVISQYNSATTQDEIDKLELKYGPQLADIDSELTFKIGGKSLTLQDVAVASINEDFNNPVYGLKAVSKVDPATGKTVNTYELQENNIDRIDFARRINPETGEEEYMPTFVRTAQTDNFFGEGQVNRGLEAQITNEGFIVGNKQPGDQNVGNIARGTQQVQRSESMSIGERLKQLGIQVRGNGTTLLITLPGENVERTATLQPDGSVRFMGDDGNVKELGVVDRNLGTDDVPAMFKAGQVRDVAYDEISDFGTRSVFGGNLAEMSNQGRRYTQSILGNTNFTQTLKNTAPIRVGNDFSGFGGAALAPSFQGTTGLLQGASTNRKAIAAEQAAQRAAQEALMQQAQRDAAARLQATPTFNLNQTPVQQFASNGVLRRQLAVTPIVTPKITRVGVAQPTQTISSVSVAPRTQNITGVSVAGPMPTIRF